MFRSLLKFSLLLLICAGLSYFVHTAVFEILFPQKSLWLINFSYKFNFGTTFLFTTTIILASRQLKTQLGFIFLAASFVKFAVFLYLIKSSDLGIGKSDFLNFFIPYVLCISLEIYYVIKILNGSNFNEDN